MTASRSRRCRSSRRNGLKFSAACFALLVAATCRADTLQILQDDRQAVQARVQLIEQARDRLDVAYFAIGDDHLALAFLALMRDAAHRGVQVRLVVDALYNDIPVAVQCELLRCGAAIREYHPVDCRRPLWLNRRMHDKLLLADRCQMIVGSRNLDYRNFGLGAENFIDRDAYVAGAAAAHAAQYFDDLWHSDEVRPVTPRKRRRDEDVHQDAMHRLCRSILAGRITASDALDQALAEMIACGWATPDVCGIHQANVCQPSCIRFLHDACGRKRHPGGISQQMLALVASARSSIVLESPYLVVSKDLEAVLTQAIGRGVRVIILTNSLASTDQTMVYAGYANQKRRLIARGIEFWEYAGPDTFHAKSVLVDGGAAAIGSYNFDPRSERLNTETAIVTTDCCTVDALIESMADHFANSWPIGPDGKPLSSAVRHPGADDEQLRELRRSRLIASLIKRHL